jgi:hypothetical protein
MDDADDLRARGQLRDGVIRMDSQKGRSRESGLGPLRSFIHGLSPDDPILPVEGRLRPFEAATSWLNSEPLTPDGLRGRVVLEDFWTYT